jgi:hypothetical protein
MDHKGSGIHFDFLSRNQQVVMWLAAHTQQQNPHKILTLLLQHGSILEIGQKFKPKSASPNITTSQHPFGPKNL